VDAVQFSRSWIRGYSYREVDEFLDRVKVALRTTEGLGASSDADEVDHFLDELASYLKEKEDGIDS
jgi:DivIVA domain-containing protein